MTKALKFLERGTTNLSQSFLIANAKKKYNLYGACKICTTNPCAEIRRKFLCMKKQIYITTNDMLNSVPLVSRTMNF